MRGLDLTNASLPCVPWDLPLQMSIQPAPPPLFGSVANFPSRPAEAGWKEIPLGINGVLCKAGNACFFTFF